MFIKKLVKEFCEAVQFKLINLVGRVLKKRQSFKGKVEIKLLYSFLSS